MKHSTLGIQGADSQILRNMANHLRDLSDEMAKVAGTVAEMTASNDVSPSTEIIQNLQKIDSLQQSLSDLAQLSTALACDAPARAKALQELKLAATRDLLGPDGKTKPVHSGSVDLF